MKARLLITGASGLVGGHVASQARGRWRVHAVFHRHPVSLEGAEGHRLDLTDSEKVFALVRLLAPQAIVHAAALTNVDQAELEPATARAVNIGATRTLAQAAEEVGARLVYVSSDMVLDGGRSWYRENDPAQPVNYYGMTKLRGEGLVGEICHDHVVARTALVYGRPIFGSNSASEWLIRALHQGQRVQLFHDQYRTPIWVENLAEALLELCENDFTGCVHLGGPDRVSRLEFGRRLCHSFGLPESLLEPVSMDSAEAVAARPRDVSLDTSLAQALLRTRIFSCDEALDRMRRIDGRRESS